jgi:hypothetical protein
MSVSMQTITTQAEAEAVGLLLLHQALERTGWDWQLEVHERKVFVTLSSPLAPSEARRAGRLDIGRLVMAFTDAGDAWSDWFCSVHDGGGETGESSCNYLFIRQPT